MSLSIYAIESISQLAIMESLALDKEKPQNENHQRNHLTTTITTAQQQQAQQQ